MDKVRAAIKAVVLLAAAALLTAALGIDWAAVVAPINDLGAITVAGVTVDAGHMLAAFLITSIPSGLTAAVAWVTRERRGYGYGVRRSTMTATAHGTDGVDNQAEQPPTSNGLDG